MLPASHRMRRPAQFAATLRGGRSAGRGSVIVHLRLPAGASPDPAPTLVGLVVGRSVGNSVVRHRVSRRLRAQLAARLDRLPAGSSLVVRARPSAARADSAEVGRDLDRALSSVLTGRRP